MIIYLSGALRYIIMNQSQLKDRHVTPLRYIIMNQSQLKGRQVTPLRYIIINQSQLKGRMSLLTLIHDNISEWSDMSNF
jgi:hypothetical protein